MDERFVEGIPVRLELSLAETVDVPLVSAFGAGASWSVGCEPAGVCSATLGLTDPPPPSNPPSSSNRAEQLHIVAIAPGKARVTLRLARPWEHSQPIAQLGIEVLVT